MCGVTDVGYYMLVKARLGFAETVGFGLYPATLDYVRLNCARLCGRG
jgi:hypothetical protein